MLAFRLLLIGILVSLICYTLVVVANHGIGLLPIFFGDILQLAWPGQFNLDFLCFLLLSGLWVAWRHEFSGNGILFALATPALGCIFVSAYLLIMSKKCQGDMVMLMIGEKRARSQA